MIRLTKTYVLLIVILFVYLPCFSQYTKTLGSSNPIPNSEGRITEVLETYKGEFRGFLISYPYGDMCFLTNGSNNLCLSSISPKRPDGTTFSINGQDYSSDIFKVIVPSQIIHNSKTYNVTSIGEKVFETKYVSVVELPNTLKRIESLTFYKCLKLKEITIPSSVEYIGDMAFKNCIALETFKMPNSVKEMGDRVFESSYRLKSITLSDNLTEIPQYTFWGCSGLETIDIPQTVKAIKSDAFLDCTNLTNVKIHNSTNVSEIAFRNCPKVIIEKYGNTEKSLEDNQSHIAARNNIQQQIGRFLSGLYREYILTDEDLGMEVANYFCTSEMKAMLRKAYTAPCEDDNCFSISPLRNNYNDGPDNTSELVSVFSTGIDSDWYLVKYKYKGRNLETLIEIVIADNKMWINRVKENIVN